MNEDQKKFFYYLESMRDGCTRDILYGYMDKQLVDEFLKNFSEKDYVQEVDSIIVINYSKVSVNPWIDVEIL